MYRWIEVFIFGYWQNAWAKELCPDNIGVVAQIDCTGPYRVFNIWRELKE